jgi:hypothetical protein
LTTPTSPLSGDEAIVLFALADKESYAFALTREAFGWRRIPLAVAEGRRVSPRKPIPAFGRAVALHLNDASSPRSAYPAVWGRFALIGEGGGPLEIFHCAPQKPGPVSL